MPELLQSCRQFAISYLWNLISADINLKTNHRLIAVYRCSLIRPTVTTGLAAVAIWVTRFLQSTRGIIRSCIALHANVLSPRQCVYPRQRCIVHISSVTRSREGTFSDNPPIPSCPPPPHHGFGATRGFSHCASIPIVSSSRDRVPLNRENETAITFVYGSPLARQFVPRCPPPFESLFSCLPLGAILIELSPSLGFALHPDVAARSVLESFAFHHSDN